MKIVHRKKLAEFNFKVLHNIVPSVWYHIWYQNGTKLFESTCEYCDLLETTEHMLFSCTVDNMEWSNVTKWIIFNYRKFAAVNEHSLTRKLRALTVVSSQAKVMISKKLLWPIIGETRDYPLADVCATHVVDF